MQIEVGYEGTTKQGDRFVVVEKIGKKRKIKFLDEFGAEIIRQTGSIQEGKLKNPYVISVRGVGRLGQYQRFNTTHKEKVQWKLLCKKYSEGKLPHFNTRWLVFEYWLEDVRSLKDYDLFVSRHCVTIYDPFGRYDRLSHLKVAHTQGKSRGIVIEDMFDGSYEVYLHCEEASYETGWSKDSIYDFVKEKKVRDGFKFWWASDYAEAHF